MCIRDRFGHPAEKLKTIGITGTKGKTTTTYMVKSILENAGYKVGLIGTIEAIIGEKHIPAANTTPESYMVQKYFHDMVEAGCDAVVMEVSSQGLMLHRTQGFIFDFGIFTNIEPDVYKRQVIRRVHSIMKSSGKPAVWTCSFLVLAETVTSDLMNRERLLRKKPIVWI